MRPSPATFMNTQASNYLIEEHTPSHCMATRRMTSVVDIGVALGGKYNREEPRRESLRRCDRLRDKERQRMEQSGQARAEEPHRVYRNERIAVHWNPSR